MTRVHGSRRLLGPLLVLSGCCGIAYEILYSRHLGNLLGNQFVVSAMVLLAFLLGIAFGTFYAHRLGGWLWAIEAAIGLYAVGLVLGGDAIDRGLALVPGVMASPALCGVLALLLLGPAAFLIGCSVPLFSELLQASGTSGAFGRTYSLYNYGAAGTALVMEFLFIRSFGLRGAALLACAINLIVSAGILWLRARGFRPVVAETTDAPEPAPIVRMGRLVVALAIASVASAIFQLLLIKLAGFVLGPYNETFSLVLATILLGIALGSSLQQRFQLTFAFCLSLALLGVGWVLAGLASLVTVFAEFHPTAAAWGLLPALRVGFVMVLGLPACLGFGATIPALAKDHHDVARESGFLLAVSSFGNAAGFLLMAFVLHRLLDYGPLLLVVSGLAGAAFLLATPGLLSRAFAWARAGAWVRPSPVLTLLPIIFPFVATFLWSENVLYIGHKNFHSAARLRELLAQPLSSQRFRGARDIFAITRRGNDAYLFLNGYISIPLSGRNASEKVVGALSSMFAPRGDRALVLGFGSGATAGAVAQVFSETEVVEINSALLDNVRLFSEFNYAIERHPGVRIHHGDGIQFVKAGGKSYSLLLNTVTTPLYFSSSALYTADFLRLARSRLSPGGIYVTWLDGRIGDEGVNIILRTLGSVFAHCALAYVKSNYFLALCSDRPPAPHRWREVATNKTLRTNFAREFDLPIDLLPYSVVTTELLRVPLPKGTPTNTLDLPTLEFSMARLSESSELVDFKRRLAAAIDPQILHAGFPPPTDWNVVDWLVFADSRLKAGRSIHTAVSRKARKAPGFSQAAYEAATVRAALALGGARGHFRAGRKLRRQGRCGTAIAHFRQARQLDPKYDDVDYYLGRCYLELGELSRALYHLQQEWQRDRDEYVPLYLARTYERLGKRTEAIRWLALAGKVGPRQNRAAVARMRSRLGLP